MEKWLIKNIKFDYDEMVKSCHVDPVTARLLVNRGIVDYKRVNEFINGTLSDFNNALHMKDLNKGVLLIKNHIDSNKSILIVGDYDVDGVISSYLLYKALTRCGANVNYHIPDRIKEGYGINESIIRKAHEDKVDLIITCDNGIAAIDQVDLANELGISVIITDHHDIPFIEENGERKFIVPKAKAVINPKQNDCEYSFKSLCGAGVVYKFIGELYKRYNISNEETIELLQYVAIATVCDVVDLVDENRIIVKKGLELLNNTKNIGLKALFEETEIKDKKITVYTLGFVLGPSINASGRLEQAFWALELLLTEDENKAKELAKKLNELNKERQELTKEGFEKAISIIENENMSSDKVLVVYLESVHESIAGIVAGRIREKYNLPTIVLTKTHEGAKGSGRSIEEYNMFEELLKCKDLLGKFGGHPMAAGMSIPVENIDEFRKRLNSECPLTEEDITPKIRIDLALPIKGINYELIDRISLLEPYGKGNSKPLFGVRKLKVLEGRILGKNSNVLKLKLTDGRLVIEGVYFGDIKSFEEEIIGHYGEYEYNKLLNGRPNSVFLDLTYFPEINEYMGNKKIQLVISNYRISQ